MRRIVVNYIGIFFLMGTQAWSAMGSLIVAQDGIIEHSIDGQARYFKDTGGVFTAESLASWSQRRWEQCRRLPMNDGYSRSAVWVRFAIADSSTRDRLWYLSLTDPQLDTVELYRADNKGVRLLARTGRFCRRIWPAVIDREPTFVLPVDIRKERGVFLLRVRTTDVCAISLKLTEGGEYIRAANLSSMLYGLYFGAIGIVVFFNLFLFIMVRFSSCIWYSAWMTSIAFFQASVCGHWSLVNGMSILFVRYAVQVFAGCCAISAAGLTISFLGLKEISPVLWRIILSFGGLGVLLILSSPIDQGTPSAIAASIIAGMFVIVCLAAGCLSIRIRGRPAIFFSSALTILTFGVILNVGRNFGLLPNTFFTAQGLIIASAAEAIILALALIDRIAYRKRKG